MPETRLSHLRTTCRICDSTKLKIFLDLGSMPLVNRYLKSSSDTETEPRFPLQIAYCSDCWLSQLTCVVDPAILYSHYVYHSSVSQTFREHCDEMVQDLKSHFDLTQDSRILEIASNDGCLQQAFKEQGLSSLGIEPAGNLAESARECGHEVINRFWDAEAAQLVVDKHQRRHLVVATNVVAHVDDLLGFFSAVREVLEPAGVFVFEVPYMTTFLTKTEFDTTYHEHLSYFLLHPLQQALQRAGLELFNVEEFEIHGGSIRVFAGVPEKHTISQNVTQLLQMERDCGFLSATLYERFSRHVETVREELVLFLKALRQQNKTIGAYGASAKGTILLNYCGLGRETISYVVDDTPAKQGQFCPGNGIPIVSREMVTQDPVDYLLLLAWNFTDELIANLPEFRQEGGRFIVPIPALRLI